MNKDLSDAQVVEVVAFLNGLSGEFPPQSLPRLPQTPNLNVIPPVDPHLRANPHK